VALLDGTYEVISQKPLGETQTRFEATAPDGTPVRIIWYEVTPEQEERFEFYRRTLKRLKREGLAALHDVVSRPGAHYVAWRHPQGRRVQPDGNLLETLNSLGFPAQLADVRLDSGHMQIYDIAFDRQPSPVSLDNPDLEGGSAKSFPNWVASWTICLVLVLIATLALVLGFNRRTNYSIVIVPDLSGQSLQQAVATLQDVGLRLTSSPTASIAPANSVLKTKPSAGHQLRPGRTIHVTFALPANRIEQTEVPHLIGLVFPDEVELRLRAANLALGAVARIPQSTTGGLVLSQRLPPGQRVGRDQTVDILVSDGPSPEATFLPTLIGLNLRDALFLANTAGLQPNNIMVDRVSSGSIADLVVSQSLPSHRPIPIEASRLRLVVTESEAADGVFEHTPNLIGMSEKAAREVAPSVQFSIEFVNVSDLPEGIIDQVPAPGTLAGDRLNIRINLPPIKIPKPGFEANILPREVRTLPYVFYVEPGIPEQLAEIKAFPLEGEPSVVIRTEVKGGDRLQGEWQSPVLGPVTFQLRLNGAFYAEARVNP
jgi:beta-lactam-binding protein with PASTA domain